MPARIFVSCGQRPGPESEFCEALRAWLTGLGFDVYIAIKIHSILDLNHDIIGGLKNSDYYLFINFARETFQDAKGVDRLRGSVYTNQELAIALGEGIEHCLFINQATVSKEGIHRYLVSNVPEFNTTADLLPLVQKAITEAGWTPSYSRHLVLARLRWGDVVRYGDHTGQRNVRVLHGDILNAKTSKPAYGVIARMTQFCAAGSPLVPSPDQSQLKASGFIGYQHTIFPASEVSFDLLALQVGVPVAVFLQSAMDRHPRLPIVSTAGLHRFRFQVVAEEFPKLEFTLELTVADGMNTPPIPTLV